MKKYKILVGIAIVVVVFLAMLISFEKMKDTPSLVKQNNFKTYTNPFNLKSEWEDYGVGDPFVMRYNGRYYMYCSTKDLRPGVKAWSSEDLVNWNYEGLVTTDTITTGAYAPEVVYWNGAFYMYTSPEGKGHYVLKCDNPVGDFKVQTENLGLSIDGSVFIDDDGKWYFTNASDKGIMAEAMTNPYTMEFGKVTGVFLNGWTEGSMIIKRNGLYYMTYTGNHVFSTGYRVNYSVSKNSPISEYTTPDNNPILISTDKKFNGLGHSSTVLGPNMDSYYIVYHNLVGSSKEGPPVRKMDIDRLVFNGSKMSALGATNYAQEVPKRPDFYQWLKDNNKYENLTENDNKLIILDTKSNNDFVAEFNFNIKTLEGLSQASCIGGVFSYRDSNNFMYASVSILEKTINIYNVQNGKTELLDKASLPQEFDFTKLHSIKIEKSQDNLKVYFDNMLKKEIHKINNPGGEIGYIYKEVNPIFDYTAFSNSVDGVSDFDAYKAVPGNIEGVHFLNGVENGFHSDNKLDVSNEFRKDKTLAIKKAEDGSYSLALNKGDWAKYNINVKETGSYGVDLLVKRSDEKASIEIYEDDKKLKSYSITPTKNSEERWYRISLSSLKLNGGFHTLKLKQTKGQTEIKTIELYKVADEKFNLNYDFTKGTPDNWQFYGSWDCRDEGLTSLTEDNPKAFTGDDGWTDYKIETDVSIDKDGASIDGGIMFRVTNESYFKSQIQDSFKGYYLKLGPNRVEISKVNYGDELLKSSDLTLTPGKTYHIKLEVEKNTFKVYVGDMKKSILQCVDSNVYSHGKVGLYLNQDGTTFKNVKISKVN